MASLSGDAVVPIKAARAKGLEQLLETTLEMASLSLAREMTAATTDGARLGELSAYVDRWCALEARRGAMPALAEDVVHPTLAVDHPPRADAQAGEGVGHGFGRGVEDPESIEELLLPRLIEEADAPFAHGHGNVRHNQRQLF